VDRSIETSRSRARNGHCWVTSKDCGWQGWRDQARSFAAAEISTFRTGSSPRAERAADDAVWFVADQVKVPLSDLKVSAPHSFAAGDASLTNAPSWQATPTSDISQRL